MRLLIAVLSGVAMLVGCDGGNEAGSPTDPDIRQARQVAAAHLPNSRADFRNLRVVPVTAHRTGIIGVGPTLVCGEINARDAQGRPVGFIRFYADPAVETRQDELTGLGRVGFDPVAVDPGRGVYAIMHQEPPSEFRLEADQQTFDWLYNEACMSAEAPEES